MIQKMIYIDDSGEDGSGQDMRKTLRNFVDVIPLTRYRVKFEVLLNDLGGDNEKVDEINFNGISLGECNPKCEGMTEYECDYSCIFYDCSSQLDNTIISSGTSTMTVELVFKGISRDCDCDKNSWECKKEKVDRNLSPMLAAVRLTLTPLN